MKVGFITVGYDCAGFLEDCFAPLSGVNFEHKIYCLHGVFSEFSEIGKTLEQDGETAKEFARLKDQGTINVLLTQPEPAPQTELRNHLLDLARQDGCEIVFILDSDEHFTTEQLNRIVGFVEATPEFRWYKLAYQNFVFDNQHYIEGFVAPRIFRTNGFTWTFSNDGTFNGKSMYELPWCQVPETLTGKVKHLSWCYSDSTESKQRIKDKIAFQHIHYGHCSYIWNTEKDCLEFDRSFYSANSLPVPQVFRAGLV